MSDSLNLWSALLFHSDDWPSLVDQGLLSPGDYSVLSDSPFQWIMGLPTSPPEIVGGPAAFFSTSQKSFPIELSLILKTAFNVAEKKGANHLTQGWLLYMGMMDEAVAGANTAETDGLLEKARTFGSLPKYWFGALLRLCCETPNINLENLLNLWSQRKSGWLQDRSFWFSHGRGVSGTNDLIQRLLKREESDALEIVAILLLGGAPLAEETETIIREQVLARLSSRSENEAVTELFLLGLTFLQPNIVEFSAWHEPRNIRLIWHRREWVVSRIMDRFNDQRERHHLLITSGFQNRTPALDHRALYQQLERLSCKEEIFPL